MGIASSAATAEPLPFVATYSINFATNKIDVTAMGDDNKVYLSGLRDASGAFNGFYDDSTAQTYTAATDGAPRKFYLYPSTNNTAQYFWGQIIADMTIDAGVDGATSMAASWSAYSAITKVG
jgi:hypothetical protein